MPNYRVESYSELPWWPAHAAAAENMQMHVADSLTAIIADVANYAVPTLKTLKHCDIRCSPQHELATRVTQSMTPLGNSASHRLKGHDNFY